MRKMPQIPRDVFFGSAAAAAEEQPVVPTPPEPTPPVPPPAPTPVAVPVEEDKIQVTIYLTRQAAKHLEGLRFHLLNDHNVKVSKSAIAEYAITYLSEDLTPLADHFAVGER